MHFKPVRDGATLIISLRNIEIMVADSKVHIHGSVIAQYEFWLQKHFPGCWWIYVKSWGDIEGVRDFD